MNSVSVTVKCLSEDVGDSINTRFIFEKDIKLPFVPKKGTTVKDKDAEVRFNYVSFDLQAQIFKATASVIGAHRYYHGDPYDECKSTVNSFKKAGWSVKKVN